MNVMKYNVWICFGLRPTCTQSCTYKKKLDVVTSWFYRHVAGINCISKRGIYRAFWWTYNQSNEIRSYENQGNNDFYNCNFSDTYRQLISESVTPSRSGISCQSALLSADSWDIRFTVSVLISTKTFETFPWRTFQLLAF